MDWADPEQWLNATPVWIVGLILFAVMSVAAYLSRLLRQARERNRPGAEDDGPEGYIVSAVMGLLALLMGFTFSLAVDRYDARRQLVREEANAIGTAYLLAQLLDEPHRERTSGLLVRYLDNRIVLAKAPTRERLAADDALIVDLWAATSGAFDSIKGLDWSSTYLSAINRVIELDASRRAARAAQVPIVIFAVLFVYMIGSAGVLGYVLRGRGGRVSAGLLLALFTLALMLVIDIDRPVGGGVSESQRPLELLQQKLKSEPPVIFDRWRAPHAGAPTAP
jgi:hypothetical protein